MIRWRASFRIHITALKVSEALNYSRKPDDNLCGYKEYVDDETDDKSESSEKDHGFTTSYDSYRFKGKKKSADGKEQQDYYALLGLGHLLYLATKDQIRKSYRERSEP